MDIGMPTNEELHAGFAAGGDRVNEALAAAVEVVRAFSRIADRARDATRALCAACHELDRVRARRGKLIAQMRAKARGRNWRTVR
jgi:hypothetical protein